LLPDPVRRALIATPALGKLAAKMRPLIYRPTLMWLADQYLRGYYAWDTERLWGRGRVPEWFDHRADLFLWSEHRIPFWVERGVFSREMMFAGCRVLDLCCGDGFYPYHFYSGTAAHIDALDRDPGAIAHARKWHPRPNIRFQRADVVADDFPGADYDVITWDAAIEHFAEDDIRRVLGKAVRALKQPTGVLCGYTIIARSKLSHPDHLHEFVSDNELKGILGEFFPHVGTVQTRYESRHNIYFRCTFDPARLRRFD
jgi:SAM-dependent methyltransferase